MSSMKDKREYYSRISRNFTFIAVILFILLILVEISVAEISISTKEHAVETELEARQTIFEETATSISDSIYGTILSPILNDYLNAEYRSPEYYYNEIKLQEILKNTSPLYSASLYNIGISRPERDASVITATNTFPKEFYLKDIDEDRRNAFIEGRRGIHLERRKDGSISEMTVSVPLKTTHGNMNIYISIPTENITRHSSYGIEVSFFDRDTGRITSRDSHLQKIELDHRIYTLSQGVLMKEGPYSIIPSRIPFTNSFILLSTKDTFSSILWIMIAVSCLILGILIAMFSAKMKKQLYKPIEEAVTLLSDGEEEKAKDEFGLIIENCRKINTLHEELESAMEAHHQMKEQQKYRAFIRGVHTETVESDEKEYFTLAYAAVDDEKEKPDVIFSRIDNAIKYIEHFHSIRINNTHNAYIYKSDEEEQSYSILYNTLLTLTFHLDGIDSVRFAITGAKQGYENLKSMFAEAEEILEYRFRIRNKFILTEKDITGTQELMDYSLSDERMLVNAMISDRPEALELFDGIVEKNFNGLHRLSQKEEMRFCYSLIGTTNRVFQEFRETPESLVGYSIDYEKLYSCRDSRKVISDIRKILSDILDRRRCQNSQEDDLMINEMKEYINEHYMENLMLIDLASRYNITPKYCSTIFKKLSNDTFKNYLNQLRIEKACQKLRENPRMKIQDLSEEVGFQSSNSFIRAFSRIMGITPGTYAENMQKLI